jgi:drug/metabolite transporter (DMT)-like permease
MVGVLFGLEFVFLYLGVLYTDSARAVIFIYLSPFVVAAGAHVFLKERLNLIKSLGLILAFLGIYFVFRGKPSTYNNMMLLVICLRSWEQFVGYYNTVYKKFSR